MLFIELSIYGVASTISFIGWQGGQALRQGLSIASVGFLIEPYVLPTGVFVALVLLGQLVGVVNIFSTIRMKR